MRVPRVAQTALLVAGFGLGWVLEQASVWSYPSTSTWRPVVDLGVGWAFLLTGFLATWRRPANRTGRLLTATGLSWYVGNLRFIGHPVAYALGAWLPSSPPPCWGHLVFAFPTGRVESRRERVFVGTTYAASIGLSGLRTLALRPSFQHGCATAAEQALRRCTTNAAQIFHSPATSTSSASARRRSRRDHRRRPRAADRPLVAGDAAGSPDAGSRADGRRRARLPVHRRQRHPRRQGLPQRARRCPTGLPRSGSSPSRSPSWPGSCAAGWPRSR